MMKKKRKILYISGTRADYGLMRQTLLAISKSPKLDLEILACGMHIMPEFGNTISEIKKDKFKVQAMAAVYKKDDPASTVGFIGELLKKLPEKIKKIRPNIILLAGDRAEALAAAVGAAYLRIPVAHVHGGDKSMTVDDVVRHTITQLASIHFPATKKSGERILGMGEEKWRINVVGAPGLDGILKSTLASPKEISKKYDIDLKKPLILVIQHPVSEQISQAVSQMQATMSAIKELGLQTIVIYPNADAGGRAMIKVIEAHRKYPFIKIYKNISRADFLGLMRVARAMVGNSSSGIIEAPSFYLPVINVGIRQQGRERAGNVIDVNHKKEEIKKAMTRAMYAKKFIAMVKKSKSPYGNGTASNKIAKILENVDIKKLHGKI